VKEFTSHTGIVLPIDKANVDTDAILPKQYLKSIKLFGFGDWLFDDDRYLDPGEVTTDIRTRRPNPNFVLNQDAYKGASIILARDNFGCGSSREHAVWALRDFGIRAVVAPSFADIFYSNCFKNGILPVPLSAKQVDELFALATQPVALRITIDLESCTVSSDFTETWQFAVDEARRNHLLNGKDEIAVTLEHADAIREFEKKLFECEPWIESKNLVREKSID